MPKRLGVNILIWNVLGCPWAPGLLLGGNMKLNVMGIEYKIKQIKAEDAKVEADGYHEPYSKEIVLVDLPEDPKTVENVEEYRKEVFRHEIVHAFLHESGLAGSSEWAKNEEIVDWITLQFPKLLKAFKEADCI